MAIERFGTLQAFEDAKEERKILDEREGRRDQRGNDRKGKGRENDGERRYMFTDSSMPPSRSSSFRRPGESASSTPSPSGAPPQIKRLDSLRLPSQAGSPLAQTHTPVPTVMTPIPKAKTAPPRAVSPSALNKLQAQALRAKLMGAPNADELQRQYDEAAENAYHGASEDTTKVEVLPTLDGRGRMYDVGHGKAEPEPENKHGKRRKKEQKVGILLYF